MSYEYDFELVPLDEKQQHALELGVGNIQDLNVKLKEILNKRAKDGWEPFYPFSVPMLWFKRQIKSKKK
jgi:hypothetical protein